MKQKVVFIIGITIFLCLLFLAVWFILMDHSLEQYQKSGVIRIGYAVEAPYAFLSETGDVTGESPETAKMIVSRLGIQNIEWRQTDFNSLIPELESGQIDVIAAGMFITPERAQLVNFSQPSIHVIQALLVLSGNPHQIHSYDQVLVDSSLKIAVLSGSIEERIMQNMKTPDDQLITVPDALTGRQAVLTGLADGLALSSPTINWIILHDNLDGFETAQPFEQPQDSLITKSGYVGFAFRKDETRLLKAWNAAMHDFIGSPEHLDIITRFGFTAEELPGSITSEDLINND